ncbi:ATPase, T2SS/T4P/T4SS family [Thiohalorhabdus denitrificans]|uniref:Type IV pilus assembly protein PilB n=1 Tax=Thiohalorhabdus denitrificans TaxID=381306 RepID=A0A1G5DHJ6_9GAMM|nr:ATPase, T2SS/T4P/T4SS family [Thiohalorhabdus denitrificans]SCY14034.1 type IV pilus assembly protein PilB [Thiohalorhabdus denitrificans]
METGKKGKKPDLGAKLVEKGLLKEQTLASARSQAQEIKEPFEEFLMKQGYVREEDLLPILSELYRIPLVNLNDLTIRSDAASLLPYEIASKYQVLPLGQRRGSVVLAMREAHNIRLVDELRFHVGRPVQTVYAPQKAIEDRLGDVYGAGGAGLIGGGDDGAIDEAISEMEVEGGGGDEEEQSQTAVEEEGNSSPMVKLVNEILFRAVQKGASDIHLESAENSLVIRFRVDGALRVIRRLPKKVQNAVISRIKVLGGMDISDARRPQDGRLKMRMGEKTLDLRVSTLPTFWGEKVVMRILDQGGVGLDLDVLGFLRAEREQIEDIMRQPQGMMLVTGPTGSGKTTTLYSVLSTINTEDINIITVEDPVEFQLPGINQVPVNPKAGMTFAAGLRSILRQDPNVIMVGEIRDQETAEIALEAAETGHMVFSTLHTTSAAGAVTRLLEMEVPGYLISSSLSGVIAQRLLRRNCPDCSEPVDVGDAMRKKYNIPDHITFYEGQGCSTCDGQGKKGRMGVYEMLIPDREVIEGLNRGASEADLVELARRSGMNLMFEDGLVKAMRGAVAFSDVLNTVGSPTGVNVDAERLLEQADLPWSERGLTATRKKERGADEPETILVVDDSRTIRDMSRFVLESEGFRVIQAEDGREGFEVLCKEMPDLVLTDMQMPNMDGDELTQKIKGDPSLARIPVVVLTSQEGEETEAGVLGHGADDFINKPIEPMTLTARVKKILATYRQFYGEEGKAPGQDDDLPQQVVS